MHPNGRFDLSFRWLQPKENVNGWIFFEYPQGSDADGFEPIFRIGVRDAAGVQFTTGELTAQESIQSSMIDVKPGTRNLNGVPIQLPGEPQPATTAPHTAPAAGTASDVPDTEPAGSANRTRPGNAPEGSGILPARVPERLRQDRQGLQGGV